MEKNCKNCGNIKNGMCFQNFCFSENNYPEWQPKEHEIPPITEEQANKIYNSCEFNTCGITLKNFKRRLKKAGYIKQELKPCPCCGRKVNYYVNNENPKKYYGINCDCGLITIDFVSLDLLFEAWNRRA